MRAFLVPRYKTKRDASAKMKEELVCWRLPLANETASSSGNFLSEPEEEKRLHFQVTIAYGCGTVSAGVQSHLFYDGFPTELASVAVSYNKVCID